MGDRSIRRIRPDDAPALAAAERDCFPDPWSESGIRETLQDETVVGFLTEGSGHLAGYLLTRTIAGESEILNLAGLPRFRRRGVGRELLAHGLEDLARRDSRSVFLEVRESNEAARNLYLGAGFRPVGIRPSYYRRPVENALVLRCDLSGGR
jgi:ribosomal-protein-alanine N-acetyltransferase